jgi:hypothetical protein
LRIKRFGSPVAVRVVPSKEFAIRRTKMRRFSRT